MEYGGVSLSLLSLDKKNAKMTRQTGQKRFLKKDKGVKKH
jgi:hypothetical protein